MGKTAWYIWAVELLAQNYKRGKREGAKLSSWNVCKSDWQADAKSLVYLVQSFWETDGIKNLYNVDYNHMDLATLSSLHLANLFRFLVC